MAAETERWLQARAPGPVRPRVARQSVVVLCGAIFLTDLIEPSILALPALYAIPVLISTWAASTRFTKVVAAICGLLVVLAPAIDFVIDEHLWQDFWLVVVNRAAALFTIAIVTSLGLLRTRIERKLTSTREAALTALRSIADAMITVDTSGRVSFLNPVAEALTGYRAEEALGHELEAIYRTSGGPPGRPPIEELPEAEGEAQGEATEVVLHARDGRRVAIEEQRTPMRDGAGGLLGQVLVFRDITERQEREDAMRRLAYRDELTGLPNRTSLQDRLSLELAHARRNREALALLYLDLDGFKEVNDELGHHAGDEYLRSVASRLRGVLRAGDTVARLGGDEFTVVLPGITSEREAAAVAHKLLAALSEPLELEGRRVLPGASVGVAVYPDDGDDAETLLRRADKAMYRAKQHGGRRLELHSTGHAAPERPSGSPRA